ncbi:hypothetical protein Goari_013822 [Gossypium aridum]|uniref:Uncharacterized protein n=1 Tax=Gossypium aridum TaxID=34290 RepID=A0A7J8XG30_GOSAI|nr:hypothetical protein [Gossypium aridum]
MKSSTTLINNNRATKNGREGFPYRELWAGPAYSNSPPPSSLPIPKFSLRVKRTVSLDLPAADPFVDVHPTGNSAPASLTGELHPSVAELFGCDDSATKTLRLRILKLVTNIMMDKMRKACDVLVLLAWMLIVFSLLWHEIA